MVKARVTGIDVGVSGHVSRMGYVSASPVNDPGVIREFFLIWLDDDQLAAVDATEPNVDRVRLPASEVEIAFEDGGRAPETFVHVNRHGVPHNGDAAPHSHPGQHALITELLRGSAELRRLLGDTPEKFCARARADARLCRRGTRLFAQEGLVTRSGLEHLGVR
ncbi:hypothetical protein ACIHAR_25955 [Streptomyces sp. NPDC052016]